MVDITAEDQEPTTGSIKITGPGDKTSYYIADGGHSRIDLSHIPAQALTRKTREMLSMALNGIKVLRSEEGYLRDWRGLAHCAKLKSDLVATISDTCRDPTGEFMDRWIKEQQDKANLLQLQQYLGLIDRWDVIDDTNEFFLQDAETFLELKRRANLMVANIPKQKTNDEFLAGDKIDNSNTLDDKLLTEDDVLLAQRGLPLATYHAFVLYADEDVEFATELIERMENIGLKLCEKSRDLLGGTLSHEAILKLISERCNRLIVIVSPAFLQSRANTFFMNYAQALGIEQQRRKIVPCLYRNCILPPQLSFYFVLRYEQSGKLYNFWDKLQQSIQSTDNYKTPAPVGILNPKITITEFDHNHIETVRVYNPNSEKKKQQILPPPPKLRPASSLYDIYGSNQSLDKPLQVSPSSVPKTATTKSEKSPSLLRRLDNRIKSSSFWDLSPTNSQKATNSNENLTPASASTSKKVKWYKKIISPRFTMTPSKSSVVPGNVTPTSTRSCDPELLLINNAPAVPNGNLESPKSNKKKKKVLAR